jgi:uncharacterized protein (TIGR03437 family)
MAPVAPGIYPNTLQHSSGTLVNAASPAHAGETVVLLASGLGDTVGVVGATINGVAAQVPSAGPGGQGVYSVSVTVPGGLTGDLTLLISSGSRVSNPVTISIR